MNKSLGIMDWGIGGLGVYSTLRSRGGNVDVIYFSDSGAIPYGKMTEAQLRERFVAIGSFMKEQGCTEVLVACNAASSAIQGNSERFNGITFHSIVPAAVHLAQSCNGKVGVIGGLRTIESGTYQKWLREERFNFSPAQPLSALVESGTLSGPIVEEAVSRVLQTLPGVESMLLACTHYPALASVFLKLSPELKLIDPADKMVEPFITLPGKGQMRFFTTGGIAQSIESARAAFGVIIPEDRAVQIFDLIS